MKKILHDNTCDYCSKQFKNNEEVSALIPVEVTTRGYHDKARLKLSLDAIDQRTIQVYCQDCLNLGHFIERK